MNSSVSKKTMSIMIVALFLMSGINVSIPARVQRDDTLSKVKSYSNKTNEQMKSVDSLISTTVMQTHPCDQDYNPKDLNTSLFNISELAEFGQTVYGLTTADFNDDGYMDFAVSWATCPWTKSTISIFFRDCNASGINFTRVDILTIYETLRYIEDLDSGDFDGDGDIDLLYTYNELEFYQGVYVAVNGTVNLLINDGENSFSDQRMVAWLGPHEPFDTDSEICPQLASADYDNDGDLDILVGSGSGRVELYLNDGEANFKSEGVLYDYYFDAYGVASGDFNNDGWIDFIVNPREEDMRKGYIYIHWNQGPPDFFNHTRGERIVDLPIPTKWSGMGGILEGCLVSLDYNNDGWLDFLYATNSYLFLMMRIGKEFKPFYVCRFPNGPEGFAENLNFGALAVADFNNDGYDDVITGGVQGFVRLFINNQTLVQIVRPKDMWWYRFDEEQYRRFEYPRDCLIIGSVTVVAEGLELLSKVEFYVDDTLMFTDDESPFEWKWTQFSFGEHIVKAKAYDLDGNSAGFDSLTVRKFL